MSAGTKVLKANGVPERIRDWMRKHPEGGFATDISADLGVTVDVLSVSLFDMHERGELSRCAVERPRMRAQYQYRATALLGNLQRAVPWKHFDVSPPRTVRRSPAPGTPVPLPVRGSTSAGTPAHHVRDPEEGGSKEAAPGRSSTPSGGSAPGSAVSALVPPAAAPAAAVEATPQPADSPLPLQGEGGGGQSEPREALEPPLPFKGRGGGGDGAPTTAMTTEAQGNLRAAVEQWMGGDRTALGGTVINVQRAHDGNTVASGAAPATRAAFESALALATAEDRAPYGPQAPRFALYSDGTLLLENLPNLPAIIAIRPEHSRALVAYLRGGHA